MEVQRCLVPALTKFPEKRAMYAMCPNLDPFGAPPDVWPHTAPGLIARSGSSGTKTQEADACMLQSLAGVPVLFGVSGGGA